MALVYLARNKVNGKTYVGVTKKTLSQRKAGHLWLARQTATKHTVFARAISKHGCDAFEFTVLVEGITIEDAMRFERQSIADLKPSYNVAAGGRGPTGIVWTDARRARMSAIPRTAEWRANISAGNKGRKLTAEQRAKVRAACRPEVHHKPVACLDDGRFFVSIKAASQYYGISPQTISTACTGIAVTAGGLHFIAGNEPISDQQRGKMLDAAHRRLAAGRKRTRDGRSRPVACLSDGASYPSAVAAGIHYSMSSSRITQLCQRGGETSTGLRFMYADEDAPPERTVKSLEELARAMEKRDAALKRGVEKNSKGVLCLDDGRKFASISAAAREYGVHLSQVSAAIHRAGRTAGRQFVFAGVGE